MGDLVSHIECGTPAAALARNVRRKLGIAFDPEYPPGYHRVTLFSRAGVTR